EATAPGPLSTLASRNGLPFAEVIVDQIDVGQYEIGAWLLVVAGIQRNCRVRRHCGRCCGRRARPKRVVQLDGPVIRPIPGTGSGKGLVHIELRSDNRARKILGYE